MCFTSTNCAFHFKPMDLVAFCIWKHLVRVDNMMIPWWIQKYDVACCPVLSCMSGLRITSSMNFLFIFLVFIFLFNYILSCQVDPRNTVGDVPLKWYKEEEHIGYDLAGKKIKKKERQDKLDSFLASVDDSKNWWVNHFQHKECLILPILFIIAQALHVLD